MLASNHQQSIIEALQRAVARPEGLPLHGHRTTPGLFGSSAAAKKSAQLCVDEGWLQIAPDKPDSDDASSPYVISEKGLAYLIRQTNPKPVLDAIAGSLNERKQEWESLVAAVHGVRSSLASFQSYVGSIQSRIDREHAAPKTIDDWPVQLTKLLANWQGNGNLDDCPLPRLYRLATQEVGDLTIGVFQDALRQLHTDEVIYLHPWTGPLYELPEPNFAFMIGHEIAYYVSLRPASADAVGTQSAKAAYQPC